MEPRIHTNGKHLALIEILVQVQQLPSPRGLTPPSNNAEDEWRCEREQTLTQTTLKAPK